MIPSQGRDRGGRGWRERSVGGRRKEKRRNVKGKRKGKKGRGAKGREEEEGRRRRRMKWYDAPWYMFPVCVCVCIPIQRKVGCLCGVYNEI